MPGLRIVRLAGSDEANYHDREALSRPKVKGAAVVLDHRNADTWAVPLHPPTARSSLSAPYTHAREPA